MASAWEPKETAESCLLLQTWQEWSEKITPPSCFENKDLYFGFFQIVSAIKTWTYTPNHVNYFNLKSFISVCN